ncbi:hypothetical protein [Parasitella parasitica]|uniref:Uncharacterized protein n=1 Tax=Parasitella parasitica TaxID=35722 RepID=A0A0B7N930_9FUNG|nr:hypothetical protein [Parasitella parasitica]
MGQYAGAFDIGPFCKNRRYAQTSNASLSLLYHNALGKQLLKPQETKVSDTWKNKDLIPLHIKYAVLLEKNGPYEGPDDDLLRYLNYDFRQSPHLLQAAAKLHTGSIIFDKAVILTITAEAYCRGKATDVHGESYPNTLPTPCRCIYGLLSVGVHNESDGKGMKRKLKIGFKTMNVLITLSVHLQKDSSEEAVDIGPESSSTPLTVNLRTARILYRSDHIKEYIETIKNSWMSYAPQKTPTSLRQLVSGFDNPSTFFYARASHEEFEVDQLMPATIITICDLPHNQGYGSAANASGKLASRFLQALAVSVINQLPIDFSWIFPMSNL